MEWTAAGTCEKDTHKQTNGCLWVLGEYVYERYAGICCDRRPCAVGWEVLAILFQGIEFVHHKSGYIGILQKIGKDIGW